jgi:hypothetical protein
VPLALACPACITPLETGARAQFSLDVTCPEHRVAVSSVRLQASASEPPPVIAADRERLRMWEERDQRRRADEKKKQYFLARGCGEERTYHCFYFMSNFGRTVCNYLHPSCVEQREPAATPAP